MSLEIEDSRLMSVIVSGECLDPLGQLQTYATTSPGFMTDNLNRLKGSLQGDGCKGSGQPCKSDQGL